MFTGDFGTTITDAADVNASLTKEKILLIVNKKVDGKYVFGGESRVGDITGKNFGLAVSFLKGADFVANVKKIGADDSTLVPQALIDKLDTAEQEADEEGKRGRQEGWGQPRKRSLLCGSDGGRGVLRSIDPSPGQDAVYR